MSLPPLPAGLTLEPAADSPPSAPRRRRSSSHDTFRLRNGERVNLGTQLGSPTGEAHDGDTFRLDTGDNARLYGVDAFELNQTGRTRTGETVPLGRQARSALLPYAVPGAIVTATGASTYGRPVARLDNGGDAAEAIIRQGYGIATPEYLKADVGRFGQYMEAERAARLNRRGAWSTSFEQPSSYRHGTPDPWNPAASGNPGDQRDAVFWDDPLPAQGLRPEIAKGYLGIWQDPASKPDDLLAYARANGFSINPDEVRRNYAERDKGRPAGSDLTYNSLPRVLTDKGDGMTGAALRGFADPINVLDEAGALADTLLPGTGRENLWNSDRRFGDVYANNLDQNRSILAADDANHPYARFGGQLASGLVIPGLSTEGVGFAAARGALRSGAGRFGAKMAARRAVIGRLSTGGAIEGSLAGAGQGETWQERATGGMIGGVAGGALGAGTGVIAPKIAEVVGRPFSKLAGRDGERAADDFTDGAVDAARARASNAATATDEAPPGLASRAADTGRRIIDFASTALPIRARKAIRERRGLSPTEGQFGPIHYNLAGPKRWPDAVKRLSEDGTGEIPGAIRHPEIGNVDVIWGTDAYGLKHIADRHPEVVDDLPAIVERMPVVQRPEETGNNRFVLDDGTHRAVIAPDFDGDTKRWVVTAYEKKTPEGADISPRSLVPDGGSTSAGAGDDVVDAFDADNLPELPDGLTLDEAPQAGARSLPLENETPRSSLNGPALPEEATATGRATPLLDPASDDLRRAQAADLRAVDVLPVANNAVASMDEAERIATGRLAPVRAPDEADELTRRTIPNAETGAPIAKRGPLDLVSWLRSEGGVRAQGSELQHYGIDNAVRKGVDFAGGENRLGRLVTNDGMTYDEAAERAWEAGFFPDHAERPTVAEFLETLADTHSGRQRAFRPDDLAEVDAFEAARRQRHEVEGARAAGSPLVEDRSVPIGADDLDRNSPPVEAYEEWGENAPDFAGNIRLANLDSPQEIRRALVHTEARAGGFDAATRGRITQAETKNLAADLGMTADDLLKRRKGQAFNAEEALAARQILARSATDLVNMAKRMRRVDVPGEEMEAAFKQSWLRHVAIQEQVAGATAEAGRALAAFRIAADARAVDRVLPSLGDIAGGTTRLKDFAEKIVDLEQSGVGPGGVNEFALKALKPRFRDKLTELYYNSLLSRPATHVVNMVGNTITALGQLPEHTVAAAIGGVRAAVARREVDRVLGSEIGARAVGLLEGTREGLKVAARTFVTGESPDAITKVEQATQRAIPGVAGSIIRTPTRALAAEDELFKAMARRMELSGLAVRTAHKEGLKGAEAKARAGELLANPTDAMLARSFDYGRYLTFQTPLGDFGRKVSEITETAPLLKLVLPFVRTPTNILKFAIERSPAAPLLKEWRRDMAKPGPARDLAVAKVMVGTGLAATIYQLAGQGAITGQGPADPGAKALLQADGWQPYSFKVGDRYYSYSRLDPYASLIGTAADLVELRSHMTKKQQENTALMVTTAVLHNVSNKTWLAGLSDGLGALSDPDQNLEGFMSRTAGAIAVPGIVAQAARLTDPVLRDARDPISRIRSRIPGLSDDLATKRDVFGRPIELEGGAGPDVASPMSTTTRRNDPTVTALLDAGAHVSRPQRKIGDRELTDVEFDRYQEASGRIAKPRLDALVQDANWRASSPDEKQDAVTKLLRDARKEAKAELFGWAAAKPRERPSSRTDLPPLPPGFKMDKLPPLPAGLTLDR